MALNYKQVSIPLVNGVDTKTDSKLNSAPLEVVNAFVERDGVLRKKFGDVQLNKDIRTEGTPYSISSGVNAASYLNDLAINTEDGFYVYLESSEEWKEHEKYRLCSIQDFKIASNGRGLTIDGLDTAANFNYGENDKYSIICQKTITGIVNTFFSVSVTDKVNGNLLDRLESIYTINYATVVTNGTDLGCLTVESENFGPGYRIGYYRVLNGSFEAVVDISTTLGLDSGILSVSDGFYIMTLDGTGYKILKVNYSGVVVYSRDLNNHGSYRASTISENPNETLEVVTISEDMLSLEYYNLSIDLSTENSASSYSVPWLTGGAILTGVSLSSSCNSEGLKLFFSTVPDSFNGHSTEVSFAIFYSDNGDSDLNESLFLSKNDGLDTIAVIQSQAVTVGESVFVHMAIYQSSDISRNFLIDQNFNIIATISELNSSMIFTGSNSYPLAEIFKDGKTLSIPYCDNGEDSISKATIDSISSDPIQFQDTLVYPSGNPIIYNGHTFFSSPFLSEPVIFAANDSTGSIAGDYLYKAIFVHRCASGDIYRSGTSNEFELTSSSNSVTIKSTGIVTSPTGAGLVGDYYLEIYQADVSDGLYRLNRIVRIDNIGQGIEETISTSSLSDSPFLYTTGEVIAELENAAPPALSDIVWHNGRVFGISSRFNELRYSKIYVRGEGLAFCDEFFIPVEDNQGRRSERATALASLDSRLIIFKPNSILVISGDGPDNAGQNNDFTEPELITTDVGCNNPKSVVLTGDGIFFQSKKGIYLLDRSLTVSYIGAGIEQFKDDEINSALLMEERELLKFTTTQGRVLLYNHFYKQWTWYDDHENAVSAVNWKGDYGYIDSSGSVFIEDQTTHRKNGEFTKRTYDTGWLKLTGIQNYQRVRKLLISGEYKDAHQLKVTLSYDYDDSTEEDYILSPQSGEDYQYSIHLRRQKSQSIRIQIEDVDTGATDEGFKITDITIEAGIKKGLNKFTSDRSY